MSSIGSNVPGGRNSRRPERVAGGEAEECAAIAVDQLHRCLACSRTPSTAAAASYSSPSGGGDAEIVAGFYIAEFESLNRARISLERRACGLHQAPQVLGGHAGVLQDLRKKLRTDSLGVVKGERQGAPASPLASRPRPRAHSRRRSRARGVARAT
jgi:hypothetical protein